jgi:hypothetical protein
MVTRAGLSINIKPRAINTLPGINRFFQQGLYPPLTVKHAFTLCDHDFQAWSVCR